MAFQSRTDETVGDLFGEDNDRAFPPEMLIAEGKTILLMPVLRKS